MHLIVYYDRLEHLAGLGDMDDPFLRHVGTLYVHDGQTAFVRRVIFSNVEVNRVRAQHVSIRRLHLNQIVALTVSQGFRSNQITIFIGVEGVDYGVLRISEFHGNLGSIRVINLECCTGIRNC